MLNRRFRQFFSVRGSSRSGGLGRLIAASVALVMVFGAGVSVAGAASTHGRRAALTNRDVTYTASGSSSGGPTGAFRVVYAKPYRQDAIKVKLVCDRSMECQLSDSVRMRVVKYGKHHKSLRATGLSAKGRYVMTLVVAHGRLTLKPGQARTVIVTLDKAGRKLVLAGKRVQVRLMLAAGNATVAHGRTSFVLTLTR